MANGQLPGSVAPTSIGQGKSYSEMVADQLGLIQQQRSANLEKRLAQDEKNREFRQQQQQNIYDFDVSGLPQAYIEKIGELQNQMAAWLDPKAEVHYENSQQLTRDIAKLNNIYMAGKRLAAGGQAAMKNYEDRMTGRVKTPGVSFGGNEETYKNRKDAYDKGGFGSIEIIGGPGDFNIMGVPLSEGENGMWGVAEGAEQVDILSAQIDPDALFRQEEIRDFINVEQKYVDASSSDMAAKQAESDFKSNPASVQAEFRAKLAAEDPKWGEINEDKTYSEGYTDEDLMKAYVAEATSGWDKFHETQAPFSMVSTTAMLTESNNIAYKLKDEKGKDTTIGLFTGGERREVTHIGTIGSGENTQIVYEYTDPFDKNRVLEAIVPFNSAEGYALMDDAGYVGTIARLVTENPDLTIEDLEKQFGTVETPGGDATTATGDATTATGDATTATGDATTATGDGAGEGGEGTGEGGEAAEAEEQQATPAPDIIGDYRAALNEMATPSPIGFSWLQSSNQKFASRIKDLPIEEQIKETKKEVRRLQGIQAQERFKNPESYRRSNAWRKAGEALDGLASIQEAQEGLVSPENISIRIDEAERLIAEKREELLDNQGRGTQKAKRRRELEQEIQQLQGEISQLDPNYGADPQTPSAASSPDVDIAIEPPSDPLPLLQAAPQNDWYDFSKLNENMTDDQMSMIGYLVEDHGITPQAAVALTSVTAKESKGDAAKKETSYYATGKRPDGTEMNNLEQIKGIFKSSMGDNAPNPLTQAELDEARAQGKEYFDAWFFDRVYGADTEIGRGLGNTEPGDGYKFRGRGLIQFTGRKNYADASEFLFGDPNVLLNNPEILAEDPNLGARAAAWYLMRNGQIKNSDLAQRENLSKEDALALADSSYALVAGESAFTPKEALQQRAQYPSGSAGQRAWLNIN